MRLKDLKPGATVYHTLYVSWGKGTVEYVYPCGRSHRARVQFEGRAEIATVSPRELRRTPNRRRIKMMIEVYAARGVEAIDDGGRLVVTGTPLFQMNHLAN